MSEYKATKVAFILLICLSLGFNLIIPFFDKRWTVSADATTFGYTSAGGQVLSYDSYNLYGSWFTTPAYADIEAVNITVYARTETGVVDLPLRCGIYEYDASTDAGALVAETEEILITNSYGTWFTCDFSSPVALSSSTEYFLVAETDWTGVGGGQFYGTSESEKGVSISYYGALPDPLEGEDAINYKVSIYASITYCITYSRTWQSVSNKPTGTFGKTDAGASSALADVTQTLFSTNYTLTGSSSRRITSLHAYASATEQNVSMGIYNCSTYDRIAFTEARTITSAGWYQFNFTTPPTLPPGKYALVLWECEGDTGESYDVTVFYDDASGESYWACYTSFLQSGPTNMRYNGDIMDFGFMSWNYSMYADWENTSWNTFRNTPSWLTKAGPGYSTFGNISSWTTKASGWNTFQNTSSWSDTSTGWNTFSNHSTYHIIDSGWNTFGSERSWINVTDGWNTFGNTATWQGQEGWNTFQNISSFIIIDQGWNTFSSEKSWMNVSDGWNTFTFKSSWILEEDGWNTFGNNISSPFTTVVTGWNTFSSSPPWTTIEDGYSTFENSVSWQSLQSGWNTFSNTLGCHTIESGWTRFGNATSWSTVEEGYNTFRYKIDWYPFETGWNTFGNSSSYQLLEQGWSSFGNTSITIIADVYPDNGDVVTINAFTFGIEVNDALGDTMNITWYKDVNGSWVAWGGSFIGVGNGTYYKDPASWNFDLYNYNYTYRVTVTSSGGFTVTRDIVFMTAPLGAGMLSLPLIVMVILIILWVFMLVLAEWKNDPFYGIVCGVIGFVIIPAFWYSVSILEANIAFTAVWGFLQGYILLMNLAQAVNVASGRDRNKPK